NLPAGLDAGQTTWVDLLGDGAPGILTEHRNTWYYKQNLGGGRFGPQHEVAGHPGTARLRAGRQSLADLTGDGRADLVQLDGWLPGIATGAGSAAARPGWTEFVPFDRLPQLDMRTGAVQLGDLTGDGLPDLLVADDDAFTWYHSLGAQGFSEGIRVSMASKEERGPRLVRADEQQAVFVADMSGDG